MLGVFRRLCYAFSSAPATAWQPGNFEHSSTRNEFSLKVYNCLLLSDSKLAVIKRILRHLV